MKHLLERLWLPLFDADDGAGSGSDGKPEGGQEPAGKVEEGDGKRPPWKDGEFDAERAWKKIQALEGDKDKFKSRAEEAEGKVKTFEERDKTETERLNDAKEAAAKEAAALKAENIRLRARAKYGLSEEDDELLGDGDEEDIEARAKRVAELKKGQEPEESRRPKERLRPGAAPSTEVEPSDPKTLASRVSRGA